MAASLAIAIFGGLLFGAFAATIAAIALILTPISVAVDRLNLPEPFYILALVGAAAGEQKERKGREELAHGERW